VGRKGSPGVPDQYWHEHRIRMEVWFWRRELKHPRANQAKLESVVDEVYRRTGLSRATIFRALSANKPLKTD